MNQKQPREREEARSGAAPVKIAQPRGGAGALYAGDVPGHDGARAGRRRNDVTEMLLAASAGRSGSACPPRGKEHEESRPVAVNSHLASVYWARPGQRLEDRPEIGLRGISQSHDSAHRSMRFFIPCMHDGSGAAGDTGEFSPSMTPESIALAIVRSALHRVSACSRQARFAIGDVHPSATRV